MTTITVEIEENLTEKQAHALMASFEEAVAKANYTLYNSDYEAEEDEED